MKLKIEKLVEGGQGIAHEDGQAYFVWEALPGEELEAEITNKRKGIYEARAVNILKPSAHRIKPVEDHFLSCSPWQIMTQDYENEIKKEIAIETYKRLGGLNDEKYFGILQDIEVLSDGKPFGYRNKMEFSFVEKEDRTISLAFFNRGQNRKSAIDGCELASPAINETAKGILAWINQNGLTERNLKALIIRSNQKGETIAGLFIKDKVSFKEYPEIGGALLGFNLYYSTHRSPASVITEVLHQEGQDFLDEEIECKGSTLRDPKVEPLRLKYGINSFFQVNIPLFEMALEDIKNAVGAGSPRPKQGAETAPLQQIIDFYSGVGTIGLNLAKNVKSVTLVESNEEAVDFAKQNIELNKVKNAEAILAPAEKALDYINENSTIIFDPPRAGLHERVVNRILEAKPPKVIYLSCNVATQARDIGLLKNTYNIKFLKLYNFFPRTPHIESLCILELK